MEIKIAFMVHICLIQLGLYTNKSVYPGQSFASKMVYSAVGQVLPTCCNTRESDRMF